MLLSRILTGERLSWTTNLNSTFPLLFFLALKGCCTLILEIHTHWVFLFGQEQHTATPSLRWLLPSLLAQFAQRTSNPNLALIISRLSLSELKQRLACDPDHHHYTKILYANEVVLNNSQA